MTSAAEREQIGESSESMVERELVRLGWSVERSGARRADGTAPLLRSAGGALILPDLRCTRGSAVMWVEVKTQRRQWRVNDDLTVRLKAKHLEHYRRVAAVTSTPVVVWWLLEHEGAFHAVSCSIAELGEPDSMGTIGGDRILNWKASVMVPRGRIMPARKAHLDSIDRSVADLIDRAREAVESVYDAPERSVHVKQQIELEQRELMMRIQHALSSGLRDEAEHLMRARDALFRAGCAILTREARR